MVEDLLDNPRVFNTAFVRSTAKADKRRISHLAVGLDDHVVEGSPESLVGHLDARVHLLGLLDGGATAGEQRARRYNRCDR
jgi:hypothetical protein